MYKDFNFTTRHARRFPRDPNFKVERHLFLMAVEDLPDGIPTDPNARQPNTRKRIYKQVQDSLLNRDESEPYSFHLKNKGITIIAESVEQIGDGKFSVKMELNSIHGIVDGGHTYKIIIDNRDELLNGSTGDNSNDSLVSKPNGSDKTQYVKVEILTGVERGFVTEIAKGLNTSVQVQPMSLDDLSGKFDWLKDIIKKEPYAKSVSWSENDDGILDARNLICILTLFNIEKYPVSKETSRHPMDGYAAPAKCLENFEKESAEGGSKVYKRMGPIAKDIFYLHDYITGTAREKWNKSRPGKGRAGALSSMEKPEAGRKSLIFIGKENVEYRLYNSVLYPILSAFRIYVEHDDSMNGERTFRWRNNDFSAVKKAWDRLAPEMLERCYAALEGLGRKPQLLGKNSSYWKSTLDCVFVDDVLNRWHEQKESSKSESA